MTGQQTQTEPIVTEIAWAQLSGRVLEGGYELEELLESQTNSAKFRVRVLGDRTIRAFVDIVRAEGRAAEERLQTWEAARRLQHPNLCTPIGCGTTEADSAACLYLVQREAEETLSNALRERPLTAEEAGQVLESVTDALEHLLENGLVHGCVSPEQIVATGDLIQLTTECVRRIGARPALDSVNAKYVAPESDRGNVTPAADIWCLGASLFEMLTQRQYESDLREELRHLPAPFAIIAERCLTPVVQARSDLSEVQALYRGEQIPEPQPVPGARPLPELVRIPDLRRTADAKIARSRGHALAPPVSPQLARRGPSPERGQERRWPPIWAYAAAALLIALSIWAAWPRRPAVKPSTRDVAARSGVPAPLGNAWETRTFPAETSPTKPQAAPAPDASVDVRGPSASKTDPKTVNGPVWRVVLFTYTREQDAKKKAQTVNQKHPGLDAEVFSPSGQGAPYLVTAGGRMNRDDAVRLRRKAVGFGMPRDSYIQNYQR
ncbi:MAG: protein kinase [Acidobacteriaceae bacterium]|nr:protein kinase [Acidobacteriaceae bacterium]